MRHIIRKQILEFSLNDKQDAFRMQQQMSEFNSKVILAMLERAMNELSVEEEVIQLDKIELDLGLLPLEEIQTAVPRNSLYEAILAGIKEAILAPGSQNSSAVTRRSLRVAKQWLFYMKNGYFDWNMIEISEDWYSYVLEAFAVDFDSVTELRQLILSDQRALKRIIMQHPDHFLVKLIEILTAENQGRLVSVIDELEMINTLYQLERKSISITKKEIRETIWEIVITITASPAGKLATDEIAVNVLKKLVNDPGTARVIIVKLSEQIKITRPFLQQLVNEQDVISQQGSVAEIVQRVDDNTKDVAKADNVYTDTRQDTGSALKETGSSDDVEGDKQRDEETIVKKIVGASEEDQFGDIIPAIKEGIFVQHAGLVLLHPFLPAFFSRLELISDARFIDHTAHRKAVCLLYYLATGEMITDEYKLVIPKLLCAYPVTDIIEKDFELNPEDIDEAENLLAAVIDQWTILKNTSPSGLREGFLQRNGKLYSKNESLYLQVEANSIDMLLDYLPWNLSIIKLPWVKEMLRVEWR